MQSRQQLEMKLPAPCPSRWGQRRPRSARARWWFNRMRQVVELAENPYARAAATPAHNASTGP